MQICFKATRTNQLFLVAGEKMENGMTLFCSPIANVGKENALLYRDCIAL